MGMIRTQFLKEKNTVPKCILNCRHSKRILALFNLIILMTGWNKILFTCICPIHLMPIEMHPKKELCTSDLLCNNLISEFCSDDASVSLSKSHLQDYDPSISCFQGPLIIILGYTA